MRLRTVLNELPIDDFYIRDEDLLEWDLIVSPEWNIGSKGVVCLGSIADFLRDGAPETGSGIMLVYVQGQVDEQYHRPPRNVVFVSGKISSSDFQEAFLHLVVRSGELAVRRETLFRCYLDSYDLRQFARRAAEVIGNPVLISNTDRKVLATAGELPEDYRDVATTVESGYIPQSVEDHLAADGILSSVRSSKHSIIAMNTSDNMRCVTSIIYHHRLEMGRFDAFEVTRKITGVDLELIDYATSLAGLMIDRLGVAGERVGMGSSILSDILAGKFEDEDAVRAHLRLAEVPDDSSFVLLRVVGQSGAGRDYYSRVGQLVGGALSGSVWTIFGSAVVVLLSLGSACDAGFDGYASCERRIVRDRTFMSALENNDMRCFVSEPFSDVMEVHARLKQCIVLDEADELAQGEPERVVFFWERRFQVVASVFKGLGHSDMLLDKRVVAMARYDRDHGSSYLETAVMSVRFPGSPAEAADALSVHRNTYFYRVNKIRDLFKLNLKDGDDRLALAFTARILEALGDDALGHEGSAKTN
ncbi:MAG: helix-turn-helix domain-containing protein [Tractidigestivibacter sp.]|jgi:hypothetical protein|uniref:PucR family transcriptional regulator n=1 Tax=Tractidigestivibacter sp. TaxID=2847320 RepID=UPI003D8C4DBA